MSPKPARPRRLLPAALLPAALLLPPPTAQGAPAWPDLQSPPAGGGGGGSKDVALVIAIGDYDHAQDLPGAVSNGRAWVSWLKEARGVGTVKVLEDASATREEILAAAQGVAARAQAGGRVWVVYIGHGAPSSKGDGGMLVGVDARQTAVSLDARSVRLDELEAALSGPQAEVVLVQDACFSGKTAGEDLAPGLAPLKVVSATLGAKWTVLSAGGNDEYAGPLSDGSRPAFSYLVLGALRGWGDANRDGMVTASEAVGYAGDALFQTVTGRTQRPQRGGPDVGLARSGGERGPELTAFLSAPPPSPAPAAPTAAYAVKAVPAGTYAVGCTKGQKGCSSDERRHTVTLTRSVLVMETEVTQALWESVMGTRPWEGQMYWDGKEQGPCAGGGVGPSHPAHCVSWKDAVAFANALSQREGLESCYQLVGSEALWPKGASCKGWRLPTEAEWEVAARGGGDPLYAGEGPVGAVAWTKENSGGHSHPVKGTLANGYGLYDMSGNVWEWVWDGYGPYGGGASVDPSGPSAASSRVYRGGCWDSDAQYARVAYRSHRAPGYRNNYLGVRLLRTAP